MEKIKINDADVIETLRTSLPLVSNSRNGLMPSLFYKMSTKRYPASSEAGYKVIASCSAITTGVLILSVGVQASYVSTGIIGVSCDLNNITFFKKEFIGVLPEVYYKRQDDSRILLAVKDRAVWSHYDVTSFSQQISADIYRIDSLNGFTKVTFS